jgi:hypothetical protein
VGSLRNLAKGLECDKATCERAVSCR